MKRWVFIKEKPFADKKCVDMSYTGNNEGKCSDFRHLRKNPHQDIEHVSFVNPTPVYPTFLGENSSTLRTNTP